MGILRWYSVRGYNGQNLFQIIRCKASIERGQYVQMEDGSRVMLDDNLGPTYPFLWSNGMSRPAVSDLTFAHIWSQSGDVKAYTSLANICLTPTFLSKLTDTDHHIKEILKFRAHELYGFSVGDLSKLEKPKGYDAIIWANPLPAVENLEKELRQKMSRSKNNRTTKSARDLGWYFSNFQKDERL